jgi:uncharacterized protein
MNLDHIPILDHHAHLFFREEVWRSTPLEAYLSEAYDPLMLERFVPDTVTARRGVRELAGFYGCEPIRDEVLKARARWNLTDLAKKMFAQCNISQVLIDDGVWPEAMISLPEFSSMTGVPVRRVLRCEFELAKLVEVSSSVTDLFERFERLLREVAPSLIGLKSIIAYRTGLDIGHHGAHDLGVAFTDLKRDLEPASIAQNSTPRINNKSLLDEMLWLALRVARDTNLPMQFHTGYGDPDLDLRLANPLHLRPIFESPDLAGLKVVMLHCYPFIKEAGYLASVYPGAFMDLGLTIPYMSTHAMLTSTLEAFHLAPITKILFSTDASRTPELYWLAARQGRRIVARALEQLKNDDDLTFFEAEWAADKILNGNAQGVYRLGPE